MPYVPVEVDRRRKIPKEVKTVWIRVRMSEKEREQFKRAAAARGVTLSEMVRSFLKDGESGQSR